MDRAHLREAPKGLDERFACRRQFARRGHELDEHLPGVASLANDEVPQVAGLLSLVVRGQPLGAGPVAYREPHGVAELGRQPAALDVEHLVPAARLVEAERGPGRRLRERVLELVAVVEDLDGRDDRLERRLGQPADPPERLAHLLLLGRDLRLVGEILETAAAAGGIVDAGRLDPLRPLPDDLDRQRLGVVPLHVRHTRAHRVPGQSAADEDDEPVQAGDAVPAVGERVDLELELLIFAHGGGHPRGYPLDG